MCFSVSLLYNCHDWFPKFSNITQAGVCGVVLYVYSYTSTWCCVGYALACCVYGGVLGVYYISICIISNGEFRLSTAVCLIL